MATSCPSDGNCIPDTCFSRARGGTSVCCGAGLCQLRHAPPVQLFLVTNLLFYLAASASRFSPFETKLQYHFGRNNLYGGFAFRLVQQHLRETGTTFAAFA